MPLADYDASVAFSLFSEISEMVFPEREPLDAPFRLLTSSLKSHQAIHKARSPSSIFLPLDAKASGLASLSRYLRHLRPQHHRGSGIRCPIARRSSLREMQACGRPHDAERNYCSGARILIEKLDQLMQANLPASPFTSSRPSLDWIEWHGEKHLKSRELWEPTN